MAIDSFLYFEKPGNASIKVEGESTDKWGKTKKAFEINSYGFGVENVATIGSKSGGAGAGKANFEVFEISKNIDSASPVLFQCCVQGVHFGTVGLALRKSGGGSDSAEPYLIYEFKLVFLNSVKWSGSGDDPPEESISFAYGAMTIKYHPHKPDGTMDTTAEIGLWSQVLNKRSADIA